MAKKSPSSRMAWFKMDVGAFQDDIMGLSNTHVAFYIKLMCTYWAKGNKLDPTFDVLKRKLGISTSGEEATLQEVLEEFFPEYEEVRQHQNLDSQLSEVQEFSATQSARAKQPRSKLQATISKPSVPEQSDHDDSVGNKFEGSPDDF